MRKDYRILKFFCLTPLILYSVDANAWGLHTHVYFAQWLVWALPLADPKLRAAVQRFPELVMAGSCLPDLALISTEFRNTHDWENCQELLKSATSEKETAIAIGYASHLFVDMVAHNHFVPAHEAMWSNDLLLTHVFGEWAMDAHLASLLDVKPYQLMEQHREILAPFAARRFRCSEQRTSKALNHLTMADRWLRKTRIPQLLYRGLRHIDRNVFDHFVYYISQTQALLPHINGLLAGNHPPLDAELKYTDRTLLRQLRKDCLAHLHERHPEPLLPLGWQTHTHSIKEILAISIPSAAPARTSLG